MNEDKPSLRVEFFTQIVLDRPASEKAGRRICKDETYVKVLHRGYKDFASRKATDDDKENFPVEWARYQNNQGENAGTTLDKLPSWSPTVEAELNSLKLNTIEKLAAGTVPDDLAYLKKQAEMFVQMKEAGNGVR